MAKLVRWEFIERHRLRIYNQMLNLYLRKLEPLLLKKSMKSRTITLHRNTMAMKGITLFWSFEIHGIGVAWPVAKPCASEGRSEGRRGSKNKRRKQVTLHYLRSVRCYEDQVWISSFVACGPLQSSLVMTNELINRSEWRTIFEMHSDFIWNVHQKGKEKH